MAEVKGKIVQKQGKKLWILLDENENEYELDNALLLGYDEVSVYIDDNVTITNAQRNFAYAIINEIFEAQYGGYSGLDNDGWLVTPESVEQYFKAKYFIRYGEKISLSRSKGRKYDANNFIDILMEFVSDHDVPLKNYNPLEYLQGKASYNHCYRSLMNKRCAICGISGDLHHVDTIGAGNNRKKVTHLGRYAVELCRKHHGELDSPDNDEKSFFEKYHIVPVKINELIAVKHNFQTQNGTEYVKK